MARNQFINPQNGVVYSWLVNHSEEQAAGKARNITRTAPTGATGLVRQQGDDGPYLIQLAGKILDRSQLQMFWLCYATCRTQTLHFLDYDNQRYEVQITDFAPQRVRKENSPQRDPTTPLHYWTYTMTLEVYAFIAGDMHDAGVTP
jgi:hypothetical protein